MENNLSAQCSQLLKRIKISNLSPFILSDATKQQHQRRIQSLSNYQKKIHQNTIKVRNFSSSDQVKPWNSRSRENKAEQQVQKLLRQNDSFEKTFYQPEVNLRKGTFSQNCNISSNINRTIFNNLTNSNVLRLRLSDSKTKDHNYTKKKQIQKTLKTNRIIHKSSDLNVENNIPQQKLFSIDKNQRQSRFSFNHANLVNQIFVYLKTKAFGESELIGEFTEIVFKLVCYFFVSRLKKYERMDESSLIQFVQNQICQSYKVMNSFRKQNSENQLTNKTILQSTGSDQQRDMSNEIEKKSSQKQKNYGPIKRRQNRVSSFFQAVEKPDTWQNNTQKKSNLSFQDNEQRDKIVQKEQKYVDAQNKQNLLVIRKNSSYNTQRVSMVYNSIKQDKKQEISDSGSSFHSIYNETERQCSKVQINSRQFIPFNNRSNVRGKSCFVTEMKNVQGARSNSIFVKYSNLGDKNDNKENTKGQSPKYSSKNNLQIQQNYKRRAISFSGLDNFASKFQKNNQNQNSRYSLASKQKISSKMNLNLNTPYDFLKQDSLMAKRIKYLELHQKIMDMSGNIQQFKKQEDRLIQVIQQKDRQLNELQGKIRQIKIQISEFQQRNKDAQDFLNGPQCPQIAQKIIQKKGQIQKNLKGLINYNAWYSSNLAQSSHINNIVGTKQSSLDKLNGMTRKFRGCKQIESIEELVPEMRQMFLITVEQYSQIIDQFQDKIKEAEQSRSNMLKNLQDWEMQAKIKERLVSNSFLDYYTVERRVSLYIEKMPQYVKRMQQLIYRLVEQRKDQNQTQNINSKPLLKINQKRSSQNKPNVSNIMAIEKQLNACLLKIRAENDSAAKQLYKQKRFAMVLEKIV